MKKGDKIEFNGLVVQRVFSGGNGPPTIVVTPPDDYAEMFRHPKYGPQLKIKAWRYTQFPEEGATVDVIGHWDEYKGTWSVSVDAQRDDEGIWSDGGHLADGAAQAPAAAHPSYDKPAQAPAPAKPGGTADGRLSESEWEQKWEQDFRSMIERIMDSVVACGLGETDSPQVNAAVIVKAGDAATSKSIARSRKEFKPVVPGDDEDIPF